MMDQSNMSQHAQQLLESTKMLNLEWIAILLVRVEEKKQSLRKDVNKIHRER